MKQARKAANLNQSQLARMAGITPSAISQIESGQSKKPSADNLLPLARALGINPEWLVTGKGDRHQRSPVQARIADAMKTATITVLDLVESCDGHLAAETVDLWLCGAAEPTDAQLDLIAGPLGRASDWLKSGISVVQENIDRVT